MVCTRTFNTLREPQQEISACLMPHLCALEMVHMLQAKLFWLSPAFPEALSLTYHPRGQSLFSTYTEANQDQILFFPPTPFLTS